MSAKITGNEPAMPTANSDRGIDFGLTIRQHYAGLAMQGLLANQILLEKGAKQHSSVNSIFQSYAKDAVDIADSLIAELNEDVTTP